MALTVDSLISSSMSTSGMLDLKYLLRDPLRHMRAERSKAKDILVRIHVETEDSFSPRFSAIIELSLL